METLFTDEQLEAVKFIAVTAIVVLGIIMVLTNLITNAITKWQERRDARDPHNLQAQAETRTFNLMFRITQIIFANLECGTEAPLADRLQYYIEIIKTLAEKAAPALRETKFAVGDATIELLQKIATEVVSLSEVTTSQEALVIDRRIQQHIERLEEYLQDFESPADDEDEDQTTVTHER